MRRLAAGLLCLSVLSACASKSPRSYSTSEAHRLETEIDQAREAASRVLADRGYDIIGDDRSTGTIETAWLPINTSYAAGFFLTENEDRYSDCGKPGFGRVYRGKQARLTVRVAPAGSGQTELLVRAAFRTQRKTWLFQTITAIECQSRGRLEEEVLVQTQIRALTNQLQRYRRGWQ